MLAPSRSTAGSTTRRRARIARLVVLALLWSGALAQASDDDDRYLDGLRQRRLFELAEKYCSDRLDDEAINDAARADLTIQLSRTLADHALNESAIEAPQLWQRAREVTDTFVARHANSASVPLVKLQGLLALAAQGEAARQLAADQADKEAIDAAREQLREAIAGFERLERELTEQLRLQARPGASHGGLSAAKLQSLQMSVQLQLAQALRNQALCYPHGTADRINALARAGEALASVIRHNERSTLTWTAELEEIARQRLLGEYSTAERKLAELSKMQPPPSVAQQIRAERMRVALARGRVDDALAEAGTGANAPHGPDVDFARLETLLAAAGRDRERQQPDQAAEWQRRAVEQAREIGRAYGVHWLRRAESLLVGSMATGGSPQTAATLSFAAAGHYRGGQFDKAVAAFDEAARVARNNRQPKAAFDAEYSAATIEKEQGNFREAADRYRLLATGAKDDDRAAAAHLLAIHCAALVAQAAQPPELDEYERLLREHVVTWTAGPTTSQAYCWLGRLQETRGDWRAAIQSLERVRPGDPQCAESVAAIGRCFEGWLADVHARGTDSQSLANDALAVLDRYTQTKQPSDASRNAALSAARIWLTEFPSGAVPAERLLRRPLETNADASASWKAEAWRWLVPALVMQSKGGQADRVLDELGSSPTEMVALLDTLAMVRSRQSGEFARKLAEFELALEDRLRARSEELDSDTLRAVRRRRAITLAESGYRKEGLEALQELAREFPRDGQTHEDIAELLAAGNEADARAAVTVWTQVARKSRPGTARWFRAYYGLARTQLRLGQPAEARATITAASGRFPQLGGQAMRSRFDQLLKKADGGGSL